MTATAYYRIAAVILALFAAGHTMGFLGFRPNTAEARAVFDGMKTVTMRIGRATFTYGGFYRGFGLAVTVYLVFSAYLAWHLGTLAASQPLAIGWLAWVFVAVNAAMLVLSWAYFSMLPAMLSALVTLALAVAALKLP